MSTGSVEIARRVMARSEPLDVPPLVRVIQTSPAAPSQWNAWAEDGTYYYLRYRHGHGRVETAAGPDSMPDSAQLIQGWTDGTGGGVMTLQEFLSIAGLQLADGAQVTPWTEGDEMQPDASPDGPEDLPVPAAAAPAAPAPEPFLRGTFALYLTPKGGVVLATNTDLTGPQQLELPKMLVRQAARGNPLVAQLLERAAAAHKGGR